MEIEIKPDERIDDLQYKNLKIIQEKNGFCFGIDSVILADFAKNIKKDSEVVDLGTGTGILGILLCGKTKLKKVTGIEIQPEVANMAERSIKLNSLENKFKIINEDIKEIINKKYLNPPYKEIGKGVINENEKKLISRHEIKATLEDFIKISAQLLKSKGEIYMVHKPERLVDIIYLMRENKLEVKELKFIYSSEGKESNLVLIKAIKGGNKFLKILEPLFIYEKNGKYSEKINRIYSE